MYVKNLKITCTAVDLVKNQEHKMDFRMPAGHADITVDFETEELKTWDGMSQFAYTGQQTITLKAQGKLPKWKKRKSK